MPSAARRDADPWNAAAIGGAGTFDGIFLSGVAAVVLVGLL